MPAILRAPLKRQCLAILRERAIPFGTILDVGAQHGTLELRDAFPDYRHVLFEPVGSCRPHIERNYATVAHEIVTAAVSDEDGETEIVTATVTSGTDVSHAWMAGPHERGKGHPVVPMITLDSYTAAKSHATPYFLKIDVDGYELYVLRGAARTLADTSVVMIEATVTTIAERIDVLQNAGFQVFDFVEPCYYDGSLWQVDVILLRGDLHRKFFRDIHKDFDPASYVMFSDCDLSPTPEGLP